MFSVGGLIFITNIGMQINNFYKHSWRLMADKWTNTLQANNNNK